MQDEPQRWGEKESARRRMQGQERVCVDEVAGACMTPLSEVAVKRLRLSVNNTSLSAVQSGFAGKTRDRLA